MGAARSTLVAAIGMIAAQGLSLIIHSRLLQPAEVGRYAWVLATMGSIAVVTALGIPRAIIQAPDLSFSQFRMLRRQTGLLALFLMLVGPVVILLFDRSIDGSAIVLALAIAVSSAMGLVTNVSVAWLQRHLQHGVVAQRQLYGYIASYLVLGSCLAWLGFGVWSLVISNVFQSVLVLIQFAMLTSSPRHAPLKTAHIPMRLRRFGLQAVVLQFAEGVTTTIVLISATSFIGLSTTGALSRSLLITQLTLGAFFNIYITVFSSSFARLQSDLPAVRSLCKKIYGFHVPAVIVLGSIVGLIGPSLIPTIMGEAWGESADLLSLLVIITAIHFLSSPFYIAIEALGSIGPKLAIQIGFVVLLLAGVIIVRPSTAERLLGMWLLVELLRTSIGLLVFSLITRDARKPRNHVDNCS